MHFFVDGVYSSGMSRFPVSGYLVGTVVFRFVVCCVLCFLVCDWLVVCRMWLCRWYVVQYRTLCRPLLSGRVVRYYVRYG